MKRYIRSNDDFNKIDDSDEITEDGKLTFDEIWDKYTNASPDAPVVWEANKFFKFMKDVENNA